MSETSRSIDYVVTRGIAPPMKVAGFRKQGRNFRRVTPGLIHVLNVQGSAWNLGADGEFTLNLGLYYPAVAPFMPGQGTVTEMPVEPACLLRTRIGRLMPDRRDHWWKVRADTDLDALAREIAEVVRRYVLPWFASAPSLAEAAESLEHDGALIPAAAVHLALGDRTEALRLLEAAIQRDRRGVYTSRWGREHGLLPEAAV